MWEKRTDGGKQRPPVILIHNFFFSWLYHTVLSSRPHLALLLFLGWVGIQLEASAPVEYPATHWHIHSLLTQAETDTHMAYISRGHLPISFHNTHTFLLNLMTASAYFHWCVWCRESLIDSLVKGQCATIYIWYYDKIIMKLKNTKIKKNEI